MAHFRRPSLILCLFALLTAGQAYPYAQACQIFFHPQSCACCELKAKGCAHCKQFGHKPAKKKMPCHAAKKPVGETSPFFEVAPCTSAQKAMASFVPEPFLLPVAQAPLALPWIRISDTVPPLRIAASPEPPVPPPRTRA